MYVIIHKIWVLWPRRVWEGWWTWWLYVLLLLTCTFVTTGTIRYFTDFTNQTEAKYVVVFRLALLNRPPQSNSWSHYFHSLVYVHINQEIKYAKREPNHVFVSTGPTARRMVRVRSRPSLSQGSQGRSWASRDSRSAAPLRFTWFCGSEVLSKRSFK